MNVQKSIEMLGFVVVDKVTKIKGVVTSISFDLYGCIQALVSPQVNAEGKKADTQWYDTNRLTITSKKRVMDIPSFAFEDVPGPADKPTK